MISTGLHSQSPQRNTTFTCVDGHIFWENTLKIQQSLVLPLPETAKEDNRLWYTIYSWADYPDSMQAPPASVFPTDHFEKQYHLCLAFRYPFFVGAWEDKFLFCVGNWQQRCCSPLLAFNRQMQKWEGNFQAAFSFRCPKRYNFPSEVGSITIKVSQYFCKWKSVCLTIMLETAC